MTTPIKDKAPPAQRLTRRQWMRFRPWQQKLLISAVLPVYLAGMAGLSAVAFAGKDLPPVESFWKQSRPASIQILDRKGRDILVRGAQEAEPVKMSRLSPHLKNAVMAVEDRRFYHHAGIDPIGLLRALRENFRAGGVKQGGSTLTQQLAKNVFLSSDKTLRRKFQEGLLAIWLEHAFSKDEIFEKYLSRIYFGGQAWGLEAASQKYFGKSAQELELSEAAVIAGLLKGPSRYNPLRHPKRSGKRTAIVLAAMERGGFITRAERYAALTTPIEIRKPQSKLGAAYFTGWIWDDVEALIGPPQQDIIVRTTLDLDAQVLGQKAIDDGLDPARGAAQAALVTLDGSGGVLAMIGGASFNDSQFNRAVQASRQPGSAFKPFVYLAAFNAGLLPWDIRMDAPIKLGDWEPRNFKTEFRGPVTLEEAFALSINTVAVGLSEEVGRQRVIETAQDFGLGPLRPLRSLPLGAQNTTPLKLTAAYLPFANWGDTARPYGIKSISTSKGQLLYQRPLHEPKKIIPSATLGHMNRIMTRTVKSGTGRRAQLPGRDVGGKTGTTNDYRDAWFIGYIPDMVTGVWVGADDNAPMKQVTGGTIPAEIWNAMMKPYTADMPLARLPISQPPLRARSGNKLDLLLSDIETALP